MADVHKEGKKSSPALSDLGREKVRHDPGPQAPAEHHFKAQNITGVGRSHTWGREASPLVGLEGGGKDRQSPGCLFTLQPHFKVK